MPLTKFMKASSVSGAFTMSVILNADWYRVKQYGVCISTQTEVNGYHMLLVPLTGK